MLGYGGLYNHSESSNFSLTFCLTERAAIFTALRDTEESEELFINYETSTGHRGKKPLADPAISLETSVLSNPELMRTRLPSERCAVFHWPTPLPASTHHFQNPSQKVGICGIS